MIEGIVTFKPLKGGYIAVELEVEDTEENLLLLSRMHKKTGHLLSEQEMEAMPQDRNTVLTEIRDLCHRVAELAEERLATPNVPPIPQIDTAEVMKKFDTLVKDLTAPDEFYGEEKKDAD